MVQPAANLDDEQKARFYAGKALATQPWVRAPDHHRCPRRAGPVYNARSCLACHIKGGRGETTTDDDEPMLATLVRLSLPGRVPTVAPPRNPSTASSCSPSRSR